MMNVLLLGSNARGYSEASIRQLAARTANTEATVSKRLKQLRELGYVGEGDKRGHRKILADADTGLPRGPALADAFEAIHDMKHEWVDPRYTVSGFPGVPETDHAGEPLHNFGGRDE